MKYFPFLLTQKVCLESFASWIFEKLKKKLKKIKTKKSKFIALVLSSKLTTVNTGDHHYHGKNYVDCKCCYHLFADIFKPLSEFFQCKVSIIPVFE